MAMILWKIPFLLIILYWIEAKTIRPKPVRPLHHSSRRRDPLSVERGLWPTIVLGSDESGTGALAGPLVTATVACLDPSQALLTGLMVRDSKALTAPQRQAVFDAVTCHPLYRWAVAVRQPAEIDQAANIQQAINGAFYESVSTVVNAVQGSTLDDGTTSSIQDVLSIVDGKSSIPNLPITSRPWIKGDATVYTIALASIVARVTRDQLVSETAATDYPQYGFEQHGGYPSQAHWHALHTYGTTPYHRRSCKLVRQRDSTDGSSFVNSPSPALEPTAPPSGTGTRSDFFQGALWVSSTAIATIFADWTTPHSAHAMYTDTRTGIRFPEEGEIAAAIPSRWDMEDLRQVSSDDSTRFGRLDASDDAIFYQEPRFVEHVDDTAVQQMRTYLNRVVVEPPQVTRVLDLCSSWTSHLPSREQHGLQRLAGLGMNAKELQANPSLTEWVVADLNLKAMLPFEDCSFDTVICQLSIDYITKPVQVCREIGRVLIPGGSVHVLFSNRLFIQKAVASWTGADDIDHCYSVGQYLKASGAFDHIAALDLSLRKSGRIVGDPLYCVSAVRTS